jgi:hypothetical protein
MQSKTLTLLSLFVVLLGVLACGGEATPTPAAMPTEVAPQPAATVQPMATPEATEQPTATEQSSETGKLEPAWEEAPCPMDLPPGAGRG